MLGLLLLGLVALLVWKACGRSGEHGGSLGLVIAAGLAAHAAGCVAQAPPADVARAAVPPLLARPTEPRASVQDRAGMQVCVQCRARRSVSIVGDRVDIEESTPSPAATWFALHDPAHAHAWHDVGCWWEGQHEGWVMWGTCDVDAVDDERWLAARCSVDPVRRSRWAQLADPPRRLDEGEQRELLELLSGAAPAGAASPARVPWAPAASVSLP